jgi:F-type H+-transporting ATPase subunit c
MKTLKILAVILAIGCIVASPAMLFAQGSATVVKNKVGDNEVQSAVPGTSSFAGSGLGAGLGAAFVIIGAGYGFGKIGAAALEGMSRQPEVKGNIQTAMIIIAALLEGATFFALLVCIQLVGKASF